MSSSDNDQNLGRRYHRISIKKKRKDRTRKNNMDESSFKSSQDRRYLESKKTSKGPPQITHKRLTNKSGFFAGALSTFVHSRGQKLSKKNAEFDLTCLLKAAKGKRSTRTELPKSKSTHSSELDDSFNDQDISPAINTFLRDRNLHNKHGEDISFEKRIVSSTECHDVPNSKPLLQEKYLSVPSKKNETVPDVNQHISSTPEIPNLFEEEAQEKLSPSNSRIKESNQEFSKNALTEKATKHSSFHTYHSFALGCIKALDLATKKCLPPESYLSEIEAELHAEFEKMHKPNVRDMKSSPEKNSFGNRLDESIEKIYQQQCYGASGPKGVKIDIVKKNCPPATHAGEEEACVQNNKIRDERLRTHEENNNELLSFREKNVELWVNAARENISSQHRGINKEKISKVCATKQNSATAGDPTYYMNFQNLCDDTQKYRFGKESSLPKPNENFSNAPFWTQPCEDVFSSVLDPRNVSNVEFPNIFHEQNRGIKLNKDLHSARPEKEWDTNDFGHSTLQESLDFGFQNKTSNKDVWKFAIGTGLPTGCKGNQERRQAQSWLAWLTGVTSPQPVESPTKASYNLELPTFKRKRSRPEQVATTFGAVHDSTRTWMKHDSFKFFPKLFGRQQDMDKETDLDTIWL